jgi:RHS repeat-associated protein
MDYMPFGSEIPLIGWDDANMASAGTEASRRFTGKEFDRDGEDITIEADHLMVHSVGLRLQNFGRRYYDSEIGMWTSRDPMGQHHSPFTYGSNNPVNRIDPDGGQDLSAQHNAWQDQLMNNALNATASDFMTYVKGLMFGYGAVGVVGSGAAVLPEAVPAIVQGVKSAVATVSVTAAANPEVTKDIIEGAVPNTVPGNSIQAISSTIVQWITDLFTDTPTSNSVDEN